MTRSRPLFTSMLIVLIDSLLLLASAQAQVNNQQSVADSTQRPRVAPTRKHLHIDAVGLMIVRRPNEGRGVSKRLRGLVL